MATHKTGFDPARMPEALGEQYRAQAENMRAMVNTMVESAQQLSAIQLETVRDAQAQQQRVMEALGKPGGQQELMSLQGTLVSEMMKGWVQYWTRVAELAQHTQGDLVRIAQQSADQSARESKSR